MTISHVLFDADGVLQTWLPGTIDALRGLPQSVPEGVELDPELLAGPNGARDALVAGFLKDVFAAEEPCLRGEAVFAEQLQPVLTAWGAQLPVSQALEIWRSIAPYPGMFALLKRLQGAGVQCHLATNQQPTRAAYMRHDLGYDELFDRSFYSCDLGVAKPAPEYFQRILASLAVAADSVLFVDDREDNVAAAVSVGIQGLHFEARKTETPERAFVVASSAWDLPVS